MTNESALIVMQGVVDHYSMNVAQREAWQTLKAAVEIANSVQQRYAKIADSIDAASGSVHMTLPGLKLFCVEWSRQLRQ